MPSGRKCNGPGMAKLRRRPLRVALATIGVEQELAFFGQLLIESEDLARPWRWSQGRDFLFERLQPPKIRRVGLVADLGGEGPYIRNSYPGLSWSSWPT